MSNYKYLSRNAKIRLNTLICSIYSSQGIIKSIIDDNGIVHLVKNKFLFGMIKNGYKKSIYDLLNIDLPRDISSTLYHSDSFISDIKEAISDVIVKYENVSELVKIKNIIDLLYNLVFDKEEDDEIWKKLISKRESKKTFILPESNIEHITSSFDIEEKRESLLFIFDGFFKPKRRLIRKTVQLCTLFLALNAFRIIGLIPTYEYSIKNKPYVELMTIPIRALFDTS